MPRFKLIFLFAFSFIIIIDLTALTDLDKWRELTPFYGSNITSLVLHPNGKIIAGTFYDGIYISNDEGKNWRQCYYFKTNLRHDQIYSLFLDRNQTIYACMGVNGLLKSTDEGSTWMKQETPTGEEIYCMASNDNGDMCIGTKTGIFLSKGGTGSWEKKLNSQGSMTSAVGVVKNISVFSNTICAALEFSGIFISRDLGSNWSSTMLWESSFKSILMKGENNIYISMYSNSTSYYRGIFRTTNGGTTWSKRNTGITTDELYCLSFDYQKNSLFAGGKNGSCFKSDDDGRNWIQLTSGKTICNTNSILTMDKKIFAATDGGGILLGTSEDNNWSFSSAGFKKLKVKGIIELDNNSLLLSNSAGLYKYNLINGKYEEMKSPLPEITNSYYSQPNIVFDEIVRCGDNSIIAGGYYGIYISKSNGISWEKLSIPFNISGITMLKKASNGDLFFNSLWNDEGLFRSKDNALTWEKYDKTFRDCKTVEVYNGIVYAGIAGYLFNKPEGESFWSNNNYFFQSDMLDLKISSSGSFFVMSQYRCMFRSSDGGLTWENTIWKDVIGNTSPQILACYKMIELSAGHLLVATQKGIYESLDDGLTWKKRNDELSGRDISRFIKSKNGYFYAATDEGLFETKLNDLTEISEQTLPNGFELFQNYPNPFNPETTIRYKLNKTSYVTLKVYDVLGREIATLVDELKQPGLYSSQFSISNSPNGSPRDQFSSGIYFYTLKAGNYSQTMKMSVMK